MGIKEKFLDAKARTKGDDVKWKATFMALLGQEFMANGDPLPIIIGGAAVELFSFGQYASEDIDIKSKRGRTFSLLAQLGFESQGTHLWYSEALDILIDWQGESFEQDDRGIRQRVLTIKTEDGPLALLPVEELIVDRLCAAKFWQHKDSGNWAKYLFEIATEHGIYIDQEFLVRRMRDEDVVDIFEKLITPKASSIAPRKRENGPKF